MLGTTSDSDLWHLADRINLPLQWIGFKNELPTHALGNYIVNLASSTDGTGGTHWCAIRLEKGQALYFDPFGIAPPKDVLKWLFRWVGPNHKKIIINQTDIQNLISNWCGQYCILCLERVENGSGSLRERLHSFFSTFRSY